MRSKGRPAAGRNPVNSSVSNIQPLSELLADLRRGELARALERIEADREFIDSSEEASYVAGLARAAHGDPAEACRHFEQTLALNPRHARALEARAIALQNLGRIKEAVAASEALVRLEPQNVAARNLLGSSNFQNGAFDAALQAYVTALRLDLDNIIALAGKALCLYNMHRESEAVVNYDRALSLAPHDKTLWHNRAVALAALKNHQSALQSFLQALELDPRYLSALEGAIFALTELERFDEARALCDAALDIAPDSTSVKFMKANALHELLRFSDALHFYDEALSQRPNDAKIATNRGMTLLQLGAFEEALASASDVLQYAPDFIPAWRCKGSAQLRLSQYEPALISFDTALHLSPEDPDLWCGRAISLKELARFDDALDGFNRALALDCAHVEAKANLGALLLLLGRFDEGLPLFEYRWIKAQRAKAETASPWPEWKGEALVGRRLLVMDEAGLGDVIQYCRYLPMLAQAGAQVDFTCRPSMRALMAGLAPGIVLLDKIQPDAIYDYCVALCSIPLAFGTRLETIPGPNSYLQEEPDRTAIWRARIGEHGFKIGVAWRGSSHAHSDNSRAAPLAALAPIAALAGVRMISLQKNAGVEEIASSPNGPSLEILSGDFDSGGDAFLDTAAVIANLDLIISIDTSIAHLAGALGKPVWIALKHVPEWRWLLERDDSPWYPTARLFRQKRSGDWDELFASMASELQWLIQETALASDPILLPGSVGELIDRLTIFEIKSERIADETKRANVSRELTLLQEAKTSRALRGAKLETLENQLRQVNSALWDIEDSIRRHETKSDFGDEFIRLARSVYKKNDRRASLKRQINMLFGSQLIEEKSYGEDGRS